MVRWQFFGVAGIKSFVLGWPKDFEDGVAKFFLEVRWQKDFWKSNLQKF